MKKYFIIIMVFSIGLFSQEEKLQQAPINPEFTRFLEEYNKGSYYPWTDEGNYLGYIPPPVDLSHLKKQNTSNNLEFFYPSTYDLRSYGKMTPVRNQESCGSCWSFATYGSLESTLLPSENRDLSENHLKNTHGFDWSCCNGGNEFMSAAYLSRWSGPWNESDDPYTTSCASTSGKPVQKHMQKAIILAGGNPTLLSHNEIKEAIMNYGAVYAAYYHDDTYYNSTYKSYYYYSTADPNHAITIAGWDDTFSRTKFNIQPPGNGAWLVKNSWGTAWGASGYFYISYYDTKLNESNFVLFFAEPVVNFDNIYQYDPLGWISNLGYGSETGWFANIFTATSNQYLVAVSFYAASYNSSYEIYIYTNANSGPISGTLAGTKTGTFAYAGYYTVPLNSPVYLTSGQKFSIVVKLTTPGYNFPIPFESVFSGYSSGASASPGQSYISSNGSSWQDITTWNSTANVCIKAFTSNYLAMEVPKNGLRVTKAGSNQITISWDPACGAASNYTIYEGNLDQLHTSGYNHYTKVCNDSGGNRTETLTPSTSNSYYIVVPKTSSNVEGSYSFSRQRGQDTLNCGIAHYLPFDCP